MRGFFYGGFDSQLEAHKLLNHHLLRIESFELHRNRKKKLALINKNYRLLPSLAKNYA